MRPSLRLLPPPELVERQWDLQQRNLLRTQLAIYGKLPGRDAETSRFAQLLGAQTFPLVGKPGNFIHNTPQCRFILTAPEFQPILNNYLE